MTETVTDAAPGPSGPRRRRRVVTTGPAVVGALLLAGAVLGVVNPGHWVVIDQVLDHAFAMVLAGCLFIAVAAALGMRASSRAGLVWRSVAATLAVVVSVGCGLALFANRYFFPSDMHVTQRISGPGGEHRAIVARGSDVIDSIWTVSVERGHGILRKHWDAACFSDDDGDYAFKDATWTAPDQLRLSSEAAGTFTLHISRNGPTAAPAEFSC